MRNPVSRHNFKKILSKTKPRTVVSAATVNERMNAHYQRNAKQATSLTELVSQQLRTEKQSTTRQTLLNNATDIT